jgi:hypothetical protein
MIRLKSFIAFFATAAALIFASNVTAQPVVFPVQAGASVQGQLISRTQVPVPGVTAFLVHPVLGRSAPSVTDASGRFGWGFIPIRPEPYFLEIYWGPNLIYRQPVQISGPVFLPPIYL